MPDDLLSSITVELSPDQRVTLAQLVDGWGEDVARFVREALQLESRETWGAHDYFGALHLRGFAEAAVSDLRGDVERIARDRLCPHDELLMSFTEADMRRLVRTFGEEATRPGWWWDRIPRTGLVREELEQWSAALNDR